MFVLPMGVSITTKEKLSMGETPIDKIIIISVIANDPQIYSILSLNSYVRFLSSKVPKIFLSAP